MTLSQYVATLIKASDQHTIALEFQHGQGGTYTILEVHDDFFVGKDKDGRIDAVPYGSVRRIRLDEHEGFKVLQVTKKKKG